MIVYTSILPIDLMLIMIIGAKDNVLLLMEIKSLESKKLKPQMTLKVSGNTLKWSSAMRVQLLC